MRVRDRRPLWILDSMWSKEKHKMDLQIHTYSNEVIGKPLINFVIHPNFKRSKSNVLGKIIHSCHFILQKIGKMTIFRVSHQISKRIQINYWNTCKKVLTSFRILFKNIVTHPRNLKDEHFHGKMKYSFKLSKIHSKN